MTTEADMRRWTALACVLGFNQLAVDAKTLGEKLYFRFNRNMWEAEYEKIGGKLKREPQDGDTPVMVIVVDGHAPGLAIEERDEALMRAHLGDVDAKRMADIRNALQPISELLDTENLRYGGVEQSPRVSENLFGDAQRALARVLELLGPVSGWPDPAKCTHNWVREGDCYLRCTICNYNGK